MVNENILFKKKEIPCEKLKRNVELEVYEKKGINDEETKEIVTSTSLMSLFEKVRNELGAKLDTHKEEVSFDPKTGLPVYCLCRAVISDANGTSKPEYGESLPTTRLNAIASNHPFTTAENRAASKAIRKYLQLPTSMYSSDEIPVESPDSESSKQDVKNIIQSLGEKAREESKKTEEAAAKEEKETTGGLAEAPIKSAMNENAIKEQKEETKPEEVVSEEVKPEPEKAEDSTKEKETSKQEKAVDTYNLDMVVTFGPGKGKTIREVLEAPECAKFVEKVRSGSVVIPENDKVKADVIKAIMATA